MHLAEAFIQSKLHLISQVSNLMSLQEHHMISKTIMVYAQLMRNIAYSQANLKKALKKTETREGFACFSFHYASPCPCLKGVSG